MPGVNRPFEVMLKYLNHVEVRTLPGTLQKTYFLLFIGFDVAVLCFFSKHVWFLLTTQYFASSSVEPPSALLLIYYRLEGHIPHLKWFHHNLIHFLYHKLILIYLLLPQKNWEASWDFDKLKWRLETCTPHCDWKKNTQSISPKSPQCRYILGTYSRCSEMTIRGLVKIVKLWTFFKLNAFARLFSYTNRQSEHEQITVSDRSVAWHLRSSGNIEGN